MTRLEQLEEENDSLRFRNDNLMRNIYESEKALKTAHNDAVQKCIDAAKQKSFNIEDQAGNHLITVELTEFISELEKLKS